MDLLVPDSWLKKFLDTKATPQEVAKYLSLCGPSIERTKVTEDGDRVYSIEVTTNRTDSASVLGIAREASAILPRFGISAKFKTDQISRGANTNPPPRCKFVKKVKYLNVTVDPKICPRFTAVLIKNVTIKDSPPEIKSLLEKVGVRPINNIVDVSNFIMHELGQPVHTFDYDKIKDAKMVLRESKKGEQVTTLDGKKFTLTGGDIVIEDGTKKLIDLCGIMGGEASAIDATTKNVLLFVQNYNQHKIRKTSMGLAQRTEAAVLFEKGIDPELVKPGILSGIKMIEKLSGGVAEREVLDIYPNPYKEKKVITTLEKLEQIIGIKLTKTDVTKYLTSLGFKVDWKENNISVFVPSFRANDINIPEDIAEEVARIYGYHNLPTILMAGSLPSPKQNDDFKFEKELKQIIKSLGGTEIYTLSLVAKEMAGNSALKLTNPLGSDSEYLRTNLMPSLISAVAGNSQEKGYIHFFEIANVYLPRRSSAKAGMDLPEERLTLSGIIKKGEYRENKGIIESVLDQLGISYNTQVGDEPGYLPNQKMIVKSGKINIGEYGNLENGMFYYSFDIKKLMGSTKTIKKYQEPSKFPPQVEDITIGFPEKTYIGDVIKAIYNLPSDGKLRLQFTISKIELKDIFEDNYTFNIQYQDNNKTLTNDEVKEIRNKIIKLVSEKFGGSIKA
jgi:phenylalanyl-tRNA synthetase beta chain